MDQPKANGKISGNFIEKTARKVMYFVYLCSVNSEKMKKNELTRKLEANGCYLCRNGANHEIWYSPTTKVRFPVPRHGSKEMSTTTVMKICKQSGVKLF